MSFCFYHMRRQGMEVPLPSPFPLGAVVLLSGLVLTPHAPPLAPPRVFWASLWRLVLSLSLLAFPGPAVSARVSSSLSTTHHVHHFHNKHGTVPIAINRMPFLTRGGHGRSRFPLIIFLHNLLALLSQIITKDWQSCFHLWFHDVWERIIVQMCPCKLSYKSKVSYFERSWPLFVCVNHLKSLI